jgi:hypothetical protein
MACFHDIRNFTYHVLWQLGFYSKVLLIDMQLVSVTMRLKSPLHLGWGMIVVQLPIVNSQQRSRLTSTTKTKLSMRLSDPKRFLPTP